MVCKAYFGFDVLHFSLVRLKNFSPFVFHITSTVRCFEIKKAFVMLFLYQKTCSGVMIIDLAKEGEHGTLRAFLP